MIFSTTEQASGRTDVIADVTVNPSQGGDLIPSVDIDRIIAQRNGGIAQFMDGMALIHAAAKQLSGAANFAPAGDVYRQCGEGAAEAINCLECSGNVSFWHISAIMHMSMPTAINRLGRKSCCGCATADHYLSCLIQPCLFPISSMLSFGFSPSLTPLFPFFRP
ncbi:MULTISPECIES: hypothetical protein [Serratia]|nr:MULTISPECIES: hypothetical protein [Serratia]ULG11285.1 methyltransferase [Serratia entomophila]ULG18178.1 methyltransferase [Serratia proteamaculans]ULG19083.1 methyltransferase [Serratia proteamaculans]